MSRSKAQSHWFLYFFILYLLLQFSLYGVNVIVFKSFSGWIMAKLLHVFMFHFFVHSLCDVIKERTFSIVKRFDTLFQLTPHYWKQRIALSTLERIINKVNKYVYTCVHMYCVHKHSLHTDLGMTVKLTFIGILKSRNFIFTVIINFI